jgi:hypothetical protein
MKYPLLSILESPILPAVTATYGDSMLVPDVKARWIAALKSGQFLQSVGQLKYKDGYCCLGVLCEVYREEHAETQFSPTGMFFGDATDDTRGMYLPGFILDWSGITATNERDLVTMNDTGSSFLFIARWIEDRL